MHPSIFIHFNGATFNLLQVSEVRSWSPGHGLLAQTISQTQGKVIPLLCPLPFPQLFKRVPRKIFFFFFKLATESQSSCATRRVFIFSSWTPVKHILIKLFLFSLWTKRRMTAGKSWWELSLHTFRSYRDKGQAPCCGCVNNNRGSPCWGPRAGAWHIVLASKRIQDEQEREIKEGSQSYLHMETGMERCDSLPNITKLLYIKIKWCT